jgi:transglutaminase-like putative cysteine protease
MQRGRIAVAVVVLLLAPVSLRAEPVLHEYVPPPGRREATSARTLAEGKLPPYIRVEDRLLPRPDERATPNAAERALQARPDREASAQPDRTTTMDGTLRYTEVFNPSVVPFKRSTSLDRAGAGYRLTVRDPTLRPVPLTPAPTPPDRDAFWGSISLAVQAGRAHPIPSVAPELRILSYSATPPAQITFYRDSADNYWIRSSESGRLRLVFLSDAPRHYFSPQVPPLVTTADVPLALRPTLPAEVRGAAEKVLRRIDVKQGTTIYRQLERLVAYFRSFEAAVLPRMTGDTYLDIALSQRGVCRHRSIAFVITAHALGIPARYVLNEAHAFTEVFVPRLGWVRIDLGGASTGLEVQNAADKALHDPGPDPFPRPNRYSAGYSQLARSARVTGVRESQRLARSSGRVSLRVYDRSSSSGRATATTGATGLPATGAAQPAPAAPASADALLDPSAAGDPTQPAGVPAKAATQISLHSATRAAYRGEPVEVWGRVTQGEQSAASLRVEIYLSRDGKVADALLGATVSGGDGRFRAALPVPRGIDVGDYQLYAVTPGDARREASLSH